MKNKIKTEVKKNIDRKCSFIGNKYNGNLNTYLN